MRRPTHAKVRHAQTLVDHNLLSVVAACAQVGISTSTFYKHGGRALHMATSLAPSDAPATAAPLGSVLDGAAVSATWEAESQQRQRRVEDAFTQEEHISAGHIPPEAPIKMDNARRVLAAKFPYFEPWLTALHTMWTREIDTLAVTDNFTLFANPEFVAVDSGDHMPFALLHELHHLVRRHHTATTAGMDPVVYNQAGDYEINRDIMPNPPDGMIGIWPHKDERFTAHEAATFTAEQFYRRLAESVPPPANGDSPRGGDGEGQAQDGGGGGDGAGQDRDDAGEEDGADGADRGGGEDGGEGQDTGGGAGQRAGSGAGADTGAEAKSDGSNAGGGSTPTHCGSLTKANEVNDLDTQAQKTGAVPIRTEDMRDTIMDEFVKAVEHHKSQGLGVGASIDALASQHIARRDAQREAAYDWRNTFRGILSEAINYVHGDVEYTWRKPSLMSRIRAAHDQRHGRPTVLEPSTHTPQIDIGIVVDTSGSMSPEEIRQIFNEVDIILGEQVVDGCTVYATTSQVYDTQHVRRLADYDFSQLREGGTDMSAGVYAAGKQKHAITVVFTDGYTDWPHPDQDGLPRRMVVCNTSHNPVPAGWPSPQRDGHLDPPSYADAVWMDITKL